MMKMTIIWRYILGIDISKQTLDCHLLDRKTGRSSHCQLANHKKGFAQLGRWLNTRQAHRSQTKLISEHTGRYGEQLLRWSTDNNWAHAVVKTTALGKVSDEHHRKTDSYDAEKLAEYGHRFADQLSLVEAPKPEVGQLRRLQAERRKMVDRRGALQAKCSEADTHDADMERLTQMWARQIALLSEHINELEDRIAGLVGSNPALNQRHQLMQSAPGMGKVLTPLWVSLHAGQNTLEARKVSSRFGFAPHPQRSGSSVRRQTRSTGFGNSEVRKVIHQAALSVVNNYPHYQRYYTQKRAEGKEHLLVINNVINKLIRLYCAMWNNRAEYDPKHIEKMKKQWKKPA